MTSSSKTRRLQDKKRRRDRKHSDKSRAKALGVHGNESNEQDLTPITSTTRLTITPREITDPLSDGSSSSESEESCNDHAPGYVMLKGEPTPAIGAEGASGGCVIS